MTYSTKDILYLLYDLVAEFAMTGAREIARTTGVFESDPQYILILSIILFAVWVRLS